MHPQVTTRKLLLVGHSQGAFYTNEIYNYLLDHGEPREAVGVYQVASPASYVAGGGKYITSSNDAVINAARFITSNASQGLIPLAAQSSAPKQKVPLPANISLSSNGNGHGFSGVYLAEAPERIVGDIQGTLKNLKPKWASDTGECFTAPDEGMGYQAAKAGFAVADTAANGVRAGVGAARVAAAAAGNALASVAQGVYGIAGKLATDVGITVGGVVGISHAAEPQNQQTAFDILSKLYGSSFTKEDYKELVGSQGSAVATAPIFAAASVSAPAPVVQPTPTLQTGLLPASGVMPLIAGNGSSGARHHDAPSAPSAPAPEPELSASDTTTAAADAPPEEATTTDSVATAAGQATTTAPNGEATSTPENITPAFMLGGSPVTDSFDSYDGSGWETYGGYLPYGFSPGVIKYFATTTECHTGGCLSGSIQIGNGGYGNSMRMYKTGTPVAEGSLIIWRKYHTGYRYMGDMLVMVCVGAPDSGGGKCDGIGNVFIGDAQDVWNKYYFAWRNNGAVKEFCTLRYDIDPADCTWRPSSEITADEVPDTVVISGDVGRPDLGDRLWFDDLSTP